MIRAFAVFLHHSPALEFFTGNVLATEEAVAVAELGTLGGVVVPAHTTGSPRKVRHESLLTKVRLGSRCASPGAFSVYTIVYHKIIALSNFWLRGKVTRLGSVITSRG